MVSSLLPFQIAACNRVPLHRSRPRLSSLAPFRSLDEMRRMRDSPRERSRDVPEGVRLLTAPGRRPMLHSSSHGALTRDTSKQTTAWGRRYNTASRDSLLAGKDSRATFSSRTTNSDSFASLPPAAVARARGPLMKPTGSDPLPRDQPPGLLTTTSAALLPAPHSSFLVTPEKRPPPPYLAEQRRNIEAMRQHRFFQGRPTSVEAFSAPLLPAAGSRREPCMPRVNPYPVVGDDRVKLEYQTTQQSYHSNLPLRPIPTRRPVLPTSSFHLDPSRWVNDG